MNDLISRTTRGLFRDLMTGSTVGAISTAFQDEGFVPDPDSTYQDTSVRRVTTQEYFGAVRWRDPAHVTRVLRVFERLNAAALLAGRDPARAMASEGPLLGALFESLVTLSVRVYAQAAEASVYHLRTRNGDHEVDLVVERDDGRVVAMEVKLRPSVGEADVKHLRWLHERLGDCLLDSVVITTGRHAYRRADGIAVVPAALLGA